MITEKMKTKFGNDSKDQVIVHDGDRSVFVSYGTPIAEIAGYGRAVTLDEDYWNYSVTTGQYRNKFLGEGVADTRKKIKDGTYQLANLRGAFYVEVEKPALDFSSLEEVLKVLEAQKALDPDAEGEGCLTCETEVINGGTWGYCAECWDEHGIKVGFGSEEGE